MTRPAVFLLALLALVPAGLPAGAETLADIRKELSQLAAEVQSLKSELVSSGAGLQAAGGATALDRMNTIEAELSRLTAQTESLQNRVDRVVADGTNRIGDLEFRLCEMETGCDPGNLPITQKLGGGGAVAAGTSAGGGSAPAATPAPRPAGTGSTATTSGGAELALNEKADFDRAKGVLDQGDFRGAADQFATFAQSYPGSPLSGEAQLMRGTALTRLGDIPNAARAYLEGFSGDPMGPKAPANLLALGVALGQLQQTQEACITLQEVGTRFPSAPETADAQAAMRRMGCS